MRPTSFRRWLYSVLLVAGLICFAIGFPRGTNDDLIWFFLGGLALAGWGGYGLALTIGSARQITAIGSGKNKIAAWRVDQSELERFATFDRARSASDTALNNDLLIRPGDAQGIEVLVGKDALVVDGVFVPMSPFVLKRLDGVVWLEIGSDDRCLEFAMSEQRKLTRHHSMIRVPVPKAAREQGDMAYAHFAKVIRPAVQQQMRKTDRTFWVGPFLLAAALMTPQTLGNAVPPIVAFLIMLVLAGFGIVLVFRGFRARMRAVRLSSNAREG